MTPPRFTEGRVSSDEDQGTGGSRDEHRKGANGAGRQIGDFALFALLPASKSARRISGLHRPEQAQKSPGALILQTAPQPKY